MDPKTINGNPYLGATKRTPRPTGPADGKFGPTGKADLAKDQAAWDAAKNWADENQRVRSERIAGIDAERAARAAEWRSEAADAVLSELRDRYLRSDPLATAEDFEADKAELLRQRRIAAALAQPTTRGRG